MEIELTIKNYRCFSDTKPARITIKPGFIAFLGINNSGKSSLLRFFYEFRDLFRKLSGPNIVSSSPGWQVTELVNSLNGAFHGFGIQYEVKDYEEVFCNANNRDMLIQIQVPSASGTGQAPMRLDVTVQRANASRKMGKIQELANSKSYGSLRFRRDRSGGLSSKFVNNCIRNFV